VSVSAPGERPERSEGRERTPQTPRAAPDCAADGRPRPAHAAIRRAARRSACPGTIARAGASRRPPGPAAAGEGPRAARAERCQREARRLARSSLSGRKPPRAASGRGGHCGPLQASRPCKVRHDRLVAADPGGEPQRPAPAAPRATPVAPRETCRWRRRSVPWNLSVPALQTEAPVPQASGSPERLAAQVTENTGRSFCAGTGMPCASSG
jgi:hypothetical protein